MSWLVDPEALCAIERDEDADVGLETYWEAVPEPVAGHKYTEREIQASLQQSVGDFSVLSQVRFNPWDPQERKIRRIDLLAVENACDAQGRRYVLAFEIKTTRSDFRSDVRDPSKQDGWRNLSSSHYFAAPQGLVAAADVPEGSGLVELSRWRRPGRFVGNRVAVTRAAPDKGRVHLPLWLTQELLYRVADHERAAGVTSRSVGMPPEQAVAMQSLEGKVEGLQQTVKSLRAQVRTWRRIGNAMGARCRRCGVLVEVVHEGAITHTYAGEEDFDHEAELDA